MPTNKEIELTLRQRSREIDRQIEILRSEQKGIEWALILTLGQSAIQQDYLCDPLGKRIECPSGNCAFSTIETSIKGRSK